MIYVFGISVSFRCQWCLGFVLVSTFSLFCSAVTRSSHRICCISVESVWISVLSACFSLFCSCLRF